MKNALANVQVVVDDFDPFEGAPIERVLRTTEAQRELWLADKLGVEASLAFNESVNLRLHGPLDVTALRDAWRALLRRHEALRATLSPDGLEFVVQVASEADLTIVDLRAMSVDVAHTELAAAADIAVSTPFDLEHGPLVRAALYRLGDDDQVLMLTAHHIVCDGWSCGIITADLAALYAEQLGEAPAPDEPASYGAYVEWESGQWANAAMADHEAYWLGRFGGSDLPVLDLPVDRPRASVRRFVSRRIDRTIDQPTIAALRKCGGQQGASLVATLFAGFAALLVRLTGQNDLVIGVPSAGQAASGLTRLVGHCVNLMPVRITVEPQQPFASLVKTASSHLLDAAEHQSLAYGALLKKLPLHRDASRLPLASVMFNVDAAQSSDTIAFPGLTAQLSANARCSENFELFVNAVLCDGGLRLECQYSAALFDDVTIERWMGAYETLLRSAVAEPGLAVGQLGWIDRGEWEAQRLLQPLQRPLPANALMHTAFMRQAAETPDRTALQSDGAQNEARLRYAELDAQSNSLARELRARGIGRGNHVGLCMSRSIEMVVALLAVLKSGAAYVPLDPSFPQVRLEDCAADAGFALLLSDSLAAARPATWRTDAASRTLLLDIDRHWLRHDASALLPDARDAVPTDAAYVIYTSGSTGKPKGVCVPHSAVANFLQSMRDRPGIGVEDVLAAVTTLSFDIAVLELMLPLTVGAQALVVSRETLLDGPLLREALKQYGVTMMQATPGLWRMLIDAGWQGSPRLSALIGGEGLPVDLAQDLLARVGELWNMYGPTETTVWSTVWRVDPAVLALRGVSIGTPIDNTTVWILDEQMQPCLRGVPGEICIGGAGVAIGYWQRPDLTADRFVADPTGQQGLRLYRTGDRGRWRSDGLLEHLGRLDFQVKVRGYRIELGEIEACCNTVEGVGRSVVVARELRPGDVRIVAYVVPAAGLRIDLAALREVQRGRLPDYMLPQHIVVLDHLPQLANGKIDRKSLPAPEGDLAIRPAERVAPRNELEGLLLEQIERVLNLPGLGVHDDFFALGGHSLLAARLTTRVNRALEMHLPLSMLFEAPTAARLASAIESKRRSSQPKRAPLLADPARASAPLTAMQQRICFVQEMHPQRVLYNTPSGHRLLGPMDVAAFEQALREIVRRQPSLRTHIGVLPGSDERVQVIEPSVAVELPYVDLTVVPIEQREVELMRRMQAVVDTPLDLQQGPLFRVALYRLEPEVHAFLFMPHHVIWDGWSFDLFYDEMAAIYGALVESRPHRLPDLAVTYGDYAQWYADWVQGEECASQRAFWKQRFASAPPAAALKPDFPRGAGMTGRGATEWVRIDSDRTEQLRRIAREHDATLNMLTMAAYTVMMSSVVGRPSVVIGVPVRGRMMVEVEPVMGFFNNLLPLHLQIDLEKPFVAQVQVIKRTLMEALANQDIPFELLAAEPEVSSHTQRSGLYQALFSFQDARQRNRQWGGLSQRAILIFQKGATEDLGLWLMEVPGGIEGGFTYNADLYSPQTATAFRTFYLELLDQLISTPSASVSRLLSGSKSTAAEHLRRLASSDSLTAPCTLEAALTSPAVAASPAAALLPTENQLATIWSALLGIPITSIRPTDNFFDLGGDSLLAMRAVERSKAVLGWRVEARRYVFESLAQLASTSVAQTTGSELAVAQKPRGIVAGMLAALGRKSRH